MATIVTFCIVAAAGAALWWLLRDVPADREVARGPKCPACGSVRTRPIGGEQRCFSCGTQFRPHAAWHLHEPTLAAVSVILLVFLALLGFAICDLVFGWRVVGEAQAALIALAGAAGVAAAVGSFLKHRRQYGRN